MRGIITIFVLLFYITLLFIPPVNADYSYQDEKDPFIAGLLSAGMMGLGQFYTKEYTKGSLFVLADLVQKGSLILLIINFNDKYTNDEEGDSIVKWDEIHLSDKILILSYLAFYFGTQIYCVVDAMKSAENYNKLLHNKLISNLNFDLKQSSNNTQFSLNFRSKF